jgi:outer membrane murein-binding lipoprotein Lpp
MKTRMLSIAIVVAGTVFTGCQSNEKKVENAQENVVEAKQELNQIVKDSIQQFRTESAQKIADHEKNLMEFRNRIAKEKKENRDKYEKKLAELEQKNSDLKKRLDDYKEESQDKWDTFRMAFSRDMDELGEAFKDLTTKDKK